MNMCMQDLGLMQFQEPVSNSRNIGSATADNSSGRKKSFDKILAGFLTSESVSTEKTNIKEKGLLSEESDQSQNFKELINNEKMEKMMERILSIQVSEEPDFSNEPIYEGLEINGAVLDERIEEIPEEEQDVTIGLFEDINKAFISELSKNLSILLGSEDTQERSAIKEKISNFLDECKISSEKGFDYLIFQGISDEMSNEENVDNKDNQDILFKKMIVSILENNQVESSGINGKNQEVNIELKQIFDAWKNLRKDIYSDKQSNEEKINLGQEVKNINLTNNPGHSDDEVTSRLSLIKQIKDELKIQNQGKTINAENPDEKTSMIFPKNIEESFQKIIDQQTTPEKVEPKDLPKFIENQIKASFKTGESGMREVTVKINPEHLGKLTLKIISQENQEMSVKIITENKNIKDFLDNNIITLRNNLETSGIKANSFNVEVDFEKNFNHFNGSNQSNSGNQGRNSERTSTKENEIFEQKIESIFNNSGDLEVFA